MKEVSLKCIEGTSSKFWTIKQTDSQLQVKYGRIGTAGQEKTTDCASSAEALASLEKQVKEKLKKGYELVSETSTVDASESASEDRTKSGPAGFTVGPKNPRSAAVVSLVVGEGGEASATATINRSQTVASSAKEAASIAASASSSTQSKSITRTVDFDTFEWSYSFHRRNGAIPLPSQTTFDLTESFERLFKLPLRDEERIDFWQCGKKGALGWSPVECHFWLFGVIALQNASHEYWSSGACRIDFDINRFKKKRVKAAFADVVIDGKIDKDQIVELFRSVGPNPIAGMYTTTTVSPSPRIDPMFCLVYPILGLVSFTDFLAIWDEIWTTYNNPIMPYLGDQVQSYIIQAIRQVVLPYLTDDQILDLRQYIAAEIKRLDWHPQSADSQLPIPYLVAGLLGMHEQLLPLISSIPDGFYVNERAYPDRARPQLLVLGLADPQVAIHHWKRLGLRISKLGELIGWIALTEWHELEEACKFAESVAESWSFAPSSETVNGVLKPLCKVKAPEVAPYIVKLYSNKYYSKICRQWLDRNPILTFVGLLAGAKGDTAVASESRKFLRDFVKRIDRNSLPDLYQPDFDAVVTDTENARQQLSKSSCPEWLTEIFERKYSGKRLSLPDYLVGVEYVPIVVDGYCLNNKQVDEILTCLKASAPDKVHPLLVALRAQTDRRQFDAFVWDIFERWLREQAPSKDKWCMLSIGYLASDETVCRLIPLMKDWRAHGNPGRAGFGLDCMRACGSDMALMKIHEISQSASLKSLRSKAQELMILIAQEKGYTTEQFEDRIVPNCGLDATGNRIFDFGPRQFRFVLGQDLKAFVKDPDGKVKTDLPSPNQSDDPVLAAQAVKDWKSIKSQVKTVAKSQATRLELAMISGRRWASDEFETLLLKHPLLKIICKTLIWGQFNDDDKLLSTFRFTDEGELADEQEQTFALVREHRVGIVHPLHLSSSQLSKWGEIVSDYGMVPPFSQLGRPSFALSEEESQLDRIDRFAGLLVEAVIIPGTLERCNWLRESVGDGGMFCGHYKYFPGKDLTAFVSYPGIFVGMLTESDKQQFEDIGFYKGRVKVDSWYSRADAARAKLADIDPIVMSEVLGDLTLVMNKAVKA